MIWIRIVIILLCIAALFITFKADFIAERIFHKEPEPQMVIRVKYAAIALVIVICILTFIFE